MRGPRLARFVAPQPAARPGVQVGGTEACDMCGADVGDDHDHLVDTDSRALMCACRACSLLFEQPSSGSGRYRLVPSRYVRDPDFCLTAGEWEELQIPVGLAFFFVNSVLGRWVAFYPSPAGATESVLPLGSWREVLERNPGLVDPDPDVEALLVRRNGDRFECCLVPIDACYRLVGLIRLHWRGFDGGAEVGQLINGFFEELAERAAPARPH